MIGIIRVLYENIDEDENESYNHTYIEDNINLNDNENIGGILNLYIDFDDLENFVE